MKIAIIGAGISGLSAGKLLKEKGFDVTIFEHNIVVGGIARTKYVNDAAYHVTGGHCFNSKYSEVLDFVFKKVMPIENWHKVQRKSHINFKSHFVSYPIEYAMKEIADFDLELATNMVKDYFDTGTEDRSNLANWFRTKFGRTLAEEYFIPYNEKIWNQKAEDMLPDWVEDKLPLPDKSGFAKALLKSNTDTMSHSSFYYPNSNNQNSFIDSLAENLNIKFDYPVNSVKRDSGKWLINDEHHFDIVINTSPLNIFPRIINDCPSVILEAASLLKYNKVTTMIWKTHGTQDTWTYYPQKDSLFHRHIHLGNFFVPQQNLSITEAVGEHSYETMVNEGEGFDYLIEPLDYHVSDHAYVVFDHNYKNSRKVVMDYIQSQDGLYTLGRFGEWEYYNMDICIKSAMRLVDEIFVNHKSKT
jgi:protoporphyrinogen oxidase